MKRESLMSQWRRVCCNRGKKREKQPIEMERKRREENEKKGRDEKVMH